MLSNPCSSRSVPNAAAAAAAAVIYACARGARARQRQRLRLRAYVSVVVVEVVVVVGTSCEVSCVIFRLVVGYGGRLNALAVHAGATLCSDVSLPPLPRLSAATDHTR